MSTDSATPPPRPTPAAPPPLSAVQFCGVVIRAAPALWRRVQARHADAAAQREAFKQALLWLASQKGLTALTGVVARYREGTREVAGRVDLVIRCDDGSSLAIEADLRPTRASAWKLLALSRTGALPLLLVGWDHDAASARVKVDEWFNKPTRHWLRVAALAPREEGRPSAPVPRGPHDGRPDDGEPLPPERSAGKPGAR